MILQAIDGISTIELSEIVLGNSNISSALLTVLIFYPTLFVIETAIQKLYHDSILFSSIFDSHLSH